MNRSYKVDAVILSRKNSGEADKIISLFSKQYGKKTIIAKGIRKISSKRAAHLELFTQIAGVLYQGKSMDYISEVMTQESYPNIRLSLERTSYACIALELIDRMTAENQEAYEIFQLLTNFLHKLNLPNIKRSEAMVELNFFKKNLMVKLGFLRQDADHNQEELDYKIEEIIERKLNSTDLLNKISNKKH